MSEVTVVGSGPSGVHFALTLLKKGRTVRMIDAGGSGPPPVEPRMNASQLKSTLADPVEYFLGQDLYGLALPEGAGEFYGFPPQKRFVFERPSGLEERSTGFKPLSSWAEGGLARAWTAGVYPFDEAELADFPFGFDGLKPHYEEVASRIGVIGREDDLAAFMPWHRGIGEPLRLDAQSESLMTRYAAARGRLETGARCFVGRSRLAVLTQADGEREACSYLARCLWGCPVGALYTPDFTLDECRRYPGFSYEPGLLVEAFEIGDDRRAHSIRVRLLADGGLESRPIETLALASGTLSTARLFLTSWLEATGERPQLQGLMDNRQVLLPFIHLPRLGYRFEADSYQYHQLSMGLPGERPDEYVHGQITTLTSAQAHPIMETMPFDLRTAGYVFRNARAALGLLNLNFHDRRRDTCGVSIDPPGERATDVPVLRTAYEPPADEPDRMRAVLKRARRGLRALGCVVAPGATHVRPMGASVHYAGTLPMTDEQRPFTVTRECRSRDVENLFIVDGSTFPFLPAKNITFSLMANAVRVAEEAF
ncbi:MAG: GMC oxidoreductase [Gemmatimonadota bacterium]